MLGLGTFFFLFRGGLCYITNIVDEGAWVRCDCGCGNPPTAAATAAAAAAWAADPIYFDFGCAATRQAHTPGGGCTRQALAHQQPHTWLKDHSRSFFFFRKNNNRSRHMLCHRLEYMILRLIKLRGLCMFWYRGLCHCLRLIRKKKKPHSQASIIFETRPVDLLEPTTHGIGCWPWYYYQYYMSSKFHVHIVINSLLLGSFSFLLLILLNDFVRFSLYWYSTWLVIQ